MWKKYALSLLVGCFLLCAVPSAAFAEDASVDSSVSSASSGDPDFEAGGGSTNGGGVGRDDVSSVKDSIDGAINEYETGITDAFDSVTESWSDMLSGALSFAGFLGAVFASLWQIVPVYSVYLILLCVFLAVLGVMKVLRE